MSVTVKSVIITAHVGGYGNKSDSKTFESQTGLP